MGMGNVAFVNDISYFNSIASHIKYKINSGNNIEKCNAAGLFLSYWIKNYDLLDTEGKQSIKVDLSDLEKKAVDILVENGKSDEVSKDLLEKYGYSPSSGDYFGEKK